MYLFGEKNGVGIVIKKVQDYEFLCNTSGNARGGGGYSHKLPIRVYAAQRGLDFEASDLERGIHFRGVF